MAYPGHSLFVMGGTLDGGADAEIWQIGIRGRFLPGSNGGEAAYLNGINDNLAQWFSSAQNHIRVDAKLTYIKLNAIAPNGDYLHPNDPHTRAMNSSGGQAPNIPPFLCVATSFKTDSPTKYALNGRIYLPNTPANTVQYSRIGNSDRADIAAAGVRLILLLRNDDNSDSQGEFTAGVVSSHGADAVVTRVRVGDVLDVQRRRKNQLRESYAEAPVPGQ